MQAKIGIISNISPNVYSTDPKRGIAEAEEIAYLASMKGREKWTGRQIKSYQRGISQEKKISKMQKPLITGSICRQNNNDNQMLFMLVRLAF